MKTCFYCCSYKIFQQLKIDGELLNLYNHKGIKKENSIYLYPKESSSTTINPENFFNIKKEIQHEYKLKKVTNRKRLSVFKSNNHIYAQIINDELGVTIASASSMEKSIRSEKQTRKELAERIGKEIAKRSIDNGIKDVAFDKGRYKYHGRIKIFADALRKGGLIF